MNNLFKDIMEQAEDDENYLKEQWEELTYNLKDLFNDYNVDLYKIINTPIYIDRNLLTKGLGATRIINNKPKVFFNPIITDESLVDGRKACGAIVHEMLHVAAYYIDHKLSHEDSWLKMANDERLKKLNIKQFCTDI